MVEEVNYRRIQLLFGKWNGKKCRGCFYSLYFFYSIGNSYRIKKLLTYNIIYRIVCEDTILYDV